VADWLLDAAAISRHNGGTRVLSRIPGPDPLGRVVAPVDRSVLALFLRSLFG